MKTLIASLSLLAVLAPAAFANWPTVSLEEWNRHNCARRGGSNALDFMWCSEHRLASNGQQPGGTGSPASPQPSPTQQRASEVEAAVAAGLPMIDADRLAMMAWINHKVNDAKQPYCYKKSYGRGAGYVLNSCPGSEEQDGALCYPKCKDGYGAAGPVCWQQCPSGYTDTGAFCHIDKPLTASGHWHCPHWWSCRKVCPSGYTNAGLFCALNTPSDPPGWKGDGLDLIKDSYGRGAGDPMTCRSDQEKNGALCYPTCNSGYYGDGPVCWQRCSGDKVDCGAGCASGKTQCAESTANMVIAPLMLAANIVTLGGSSEFEEAQTAFKTAAKAGDKEAAKAAFSRMLETWADNMAKLTTEDVAKQIEAKFSKTTARWLAKEYAKMQYYEAAQSEPTLRSAISDAAGLDPTGVASVVDAYTQPKCALDEPMPSVTALK